MSFKQDRKLLLEQQRREQAWSARQAQRQMQFQERMSSTAHTREVADLKAAGLNPVLSANGSGAASANGAMAESSTIIPELTELLRASHSGSGGGSGSGKTQVIIEQPETPSQYFTPRQFKQGTHAGQGVFHGSAKGFAKSEERVNAMVKNARRELAESFKDVSFSAGIRGTMRGTLMPTGSARFTGDDALKVYDAYTKFQKAKGMAYRNRMYQNLVGTDKVIKNIKAQCRRILESGRIDPEARKRLQEIAYY